MHKHGQKGKRRQEERANPQPHHSIKLERCYEALEAKSEAEMSRTVYWETMQQWSEYNTQDGMYKSMYKLCEGHLWK